MGPGDDSKKASIADEQTGSADVELAACICATKRCHGQRGRGNMNAVDARSQDGGRIIRGPDA